MPSPLPYADDFSKHTVLQQVKCSRIPNPSTKPRPSSSVRRSPFSVSSTGSPRYNIVSPSSKATMSPTETKIPRKIQTLTDAHIKKVSKNGDTTRPHRSNLPVFINTHKSSAKSSPICATHKILTPPISCNKPLPSPPIAQIIDPNSPPKAQRTLVDADYSSPSVKEWPILHPENVSPPKNLMVFVGDHPTLQQRCVSESAVPRPFARSSLTKKIVSDNEPILKRSATQDSSSKDLNDMHMNETGICSSKTLYASTFHAISTSSDLAVESPVPYIRNQPAAVSIPPRISSKRHSLPILKKNQFGTSALSRSSLPQRMIGDFAQWPIREDEERGESATKISILISSEASSSAVHGKVQSLTADETVFRSSNPRAASSCDKHEQHDGKSEVHNEGLSLQPYAPEYGLLPRISGVADDCLLRYRQSTSKTPISPPNIPAKSPSNQLSIQSAEQSLNADMTKLSERIPSPSSSHHSEVRSNKTTPVKITPIRSMQPPRMVSPETSPMVDPSPVSPISMEADTSTTSSPLYPVNDGTTAQSSQRMTSSTLKLVTEESAKNITKSHKSTISQIPVKNDVKQVRCIAQNSTPKTTEERLPAKWTLPRFTSIRSDKSTTTSTKTHNFLDSACDPSIQNNSSKNSMPLSDFFACPDTDISPKPENTRDLSVLDSNVATPICSERATPISLPSPRGPGSVKECIEGAHAKKEEEALKKAKPRRSFRNMFHKFDSKQSENSPSGTESKQSSMHGVQGSLARRIRASASFSKVHLSLMPQSQNKRKLIALADKAPAKSRRPTKDGSVKTAPWSLEEVPTSPTQETPVSFHHNTADVVTNIIDRVTSMPLESPDRLRGLEIAEAVLHAFECYTEASKNAEKARMHARNAELNAERAALELARFQKLCEPIFDGETLHAVKEFVKRAGIVKEDHGGLEGLSIAKE